MRDDLHACAVQHEIRERFGHDPFYLALDAVEHLQATIAQDGSGSIADSAGQFVDISQLTAIWWRRSPRHQKTLKVANEVQQDLLERDWRSFLRGALLTSFKGRWVSHPDATDAASLKPIQLKLAQAAGLRIPKTIISNEPSKVKNFIRSLPHGAVAKTTHGTGKSAIFAARVFESNLPDDDSIAISPTIYQEYIAGSDHLRITIFGHDFYAASLRSGDMDWRKQVPAKMTPFEIDNTMKTKLLKYQNLAGLEMGVIDMKISSDGELIWLENNPQGQFLFVEGLSGLHLTRACADFLVSD